MKLSPADTQALVKRVNQDLEAINKERHTGMPLREITAVLAGHNLDASKIQDHLHGDEGRLNVQIAAEIWLSLSWYRMPQPSGRYEIVAYVSSLHDDHRDPYTTVMNAADKRKAKNKLNNMLHPVNKDRQPSLAHAFGQIKDAIAACGLDWHEFEDETSNFNAGNEGRKNIPIGNGLYLSVSWYRDPVTKGKWEIVTVSS